MLSSRTSGGVSVNNVSMLANTNFIASPGDLFKSIKGMYRILSLISEQEKEGFVDKIIIAQDSLCDFIRTICPGAYSSATRVNLNALDNLTVRPIGIYGSKQEIVRFLLAIGVTNKATANKLLTAKDNVSGSSNFTLRSGLYIVSPPSATNTDQQIYVLYWPQDKTWNDVAPDSIKRNRTAFMHYLMKICDQVVCLISPNHAQSIVWEDENDIPLPDVDEESDRLFTFEASRKNMNTRPGFQVSSSIPMLEVTWVKLDLLQVTSPSICIPDTSECSANEKLFTSRLLHGETTQGFITGKYIPPRKRAHKISLTLAQPALRKIIESGAICLSKGLDEDAINILIQCGLRDRFPAECMNWENGVTEAHKLREEKVNQMKANLRKELDSKSAQLEDRLRQSIVDSTVNTFPTVHHASLSSALLYGQSVAEAADVAQNSTETTISKFLDKIVHTSFRLQEEECTKLIEQEASNDENKVITHLQTDFIHQIEQYSQAESNLHTHFIDSVQYATDGPYEYAAYHLEGRRDSVQDPMMEFTIHLLGLTAEHQHAMQLLPTFVPSPHVRTRSPHSFRLPVGHNIEHAQILENGRLLLVVVDDRQNQAFIYLNTLAGMDGAIRRKKRKILRYDKIGEGFIFAYEESKRTLVLCVPTKLQLYAFIFDETYKSMKALDQAVDLFPRYNDPGISISHMCIVCNTEEVILVDSRAQARMFSLNTLQFRPISLQLESIPSSVQSSPDGSFLLTSYITDSDSQICFTAYHLNTFGSIPGISFGPLDLSTTDQWVLTSFNRTSIHLMGIDAVNHQCRSTVLEVTQAITEFTFKEKGVRNTSHAQSGSAMHNCLIECHAEVWASFPVLPACRRIISSSNRRHQKSLTFITDHDHHKFPSHFADMIHTFEKTTREPTGEALQSIMVSAVSFDYWVVKLAINEAWKTSHFRVGEWLANLLYLVREEDMRLRAQMEGLTSSTQTLFQCRVCLEDLSEDFITRIEPCRHSFCRTCIKDHITAKLMEHRFPILCPMCMTDGGESHPSTITTTLAQQVGITEEQHQTWINMEMAAFSILLHCRLCKRSAFVDKQDFEDTKTVTCPFPNCNHLWCTMCQQSIAEGGSQHSCDGSKELDHLMTTRGWKYCPSCKTPIAKDNGCNHMTCISPGCNTHFCYTCGQSIIQSAFPGAVRAATNRHYTRCSLFENVPDPDVWP